MTRFLLKYFVVLHEISTNIIRFLQAKTNELISTWLST